MVLDFLSELKIILREKDCPFFSDDDLVYYYEKNGKSLEATARQCLILKSENTTLNVSGLSCADTSKYFLRLSQMYRKNNSGTLRG